MKDFFALVIAGLTFAFCALTILAIMSLPIAIAIIVWRAVFA